jgi:hypothetical protein
MTAWLMKWAPQEAGKFSLGPAVLSVVAATAATVGRYTVFNDLVDIYPYWLYMKRVS